MAKAKLTIFREIERNMEVMKQWHEYLSYKSQRMEEWEKGREKEKKKERESKKEREKRARESLEFRWDFQSNWIGWLRQRQMPQTRSIYHALTYHSMLVDSFSPATSEWGRVFFFRSIIQYPAINERHVLHTYAISLSNQKSDENCPKIDYNGQQHRQKAANTTWNTA